MKERSKWERENIRDNEERKDEEERQRKRVKQKDWGGGEKGMKEGRKRGGKAVR